MKRVLSFAAIFLLAAVCVPFGFAQTKKQPSKQKAPAARASVPADPQQALLQSAYDAIEKEDFQSAYPRLKKYLADKPDDAQAQFQFGFACVKLGHNEEAEAAYRRAIELDPKMAAAYQNLGAFLVKSNPAEAKKYLATAAQLQPENADVIFLLGVADDGLNNLDGAIESYRKAAQARANDFTFRLTYAWALLRVRKPADAEPEFRAALALQPDASQAQLGLAECLNAQGKSQQAMDALRKYLQTQPNDHATRVLLASLLFDADKTKESIAELERAEKSGHQSLESWKLRAKILIRLRRFDEAIVVAQSILKEQPASAEWHARLGRLHLEKRNFPAAEAALLAALKLDAAHSDALRDLVSVYYLGEKYEAALGALDELERREPADAGHWFVRANCLDRLGRKPEALAAYEKFVALDDNRNTDKNFQARARIQLLKRELERKR
ncbi:MAG TPA: tetratricopeptide repeat protein [Candidatus Nitrosotenuis sp.]|nr:tetratricopeptide repeat protein [Candidatus Nitrosotenuis sp.]